MKLHVVRRAFSAEKPFLRLALTLLLWLLLMYVAHILTPSIPCNTYVEGVQCVMHETTWRHVADIVLAASCTTLVFGWSRLVWRGQGISNRALHVTRFAYSLTLLFLGIYTVIAIAGLVQAGS